ncbi:MAG: alpha/beta hydrolase, partial [Bacteroidales bacterium]|nr:alpha/beta hydrolase [Bacteroidales bacterium]
MDGNNIMMKNDHLRLLSESLASEGIATLRYNKRTVPANGNPIDESKLRFEDFVHDATFLLSILKTDKRFDKVAILGHSQGALIATLAAQRVKADRLFLVAGPGEPISLTLIRQVSVNGEQIGNEAKIIVDSLMAGHRVTKVHPMLITVFRPSVQDFMISWMKYDPAKELQLTKAKKVIIQGETDIQVRKEDAMMLKRANPRADVHFISDMNHI